eukprot:CAMPEP_0182550620 /NCGR_PEP_ID=MMETSP1323-20130603/42025_1 /TAXON_ID=236787 /ORGANISM="Florenciella parvula, Strain RCC1693" /LENGTH=67 /DNA_ID=CAMNT_0024762169 /DNA_START=281 /DNA_END=484 /DNA_ORIENTATION=+
MQHGTEFGPTSRVPCIYSRASHSRAHSSAVAVAVVMAVAVVVAVVVAVIVRVRRLASDSGERKQHGE